MSAEDAVSDQVSKLYTYPVAAWAIGLLFLWVTDNIGMAIALCYPLALWWVGVSVWWSRRTHQLVGAGKLSRENASEGVVWIGHTLAGVAGAPAIIFLAADPLHRAAWATTGSVVIVCVITYVAVSALSKLQRTGADTAALVISCLAMPLNASAAIGFGWWLGLFQTALDVADTVVPI